MTVVFGILTDPTGRPMQRHRVNISVRAPGFTALQSAVATSVTLDTGEDGRWETPLIPNASYVTPGSWYHVDWRVHPGDVNAEFDFQVPASGGPFELGDLLYAPPSP
jgi:hypothetical protein